jgi:hypothetical protein
VVHRDLLSHNGDANRVRPVGPANDLYICMVHTSQMLQHHLLDGEIEKALMTAAS